MQKIKEKSWNLNLANEEKLELKTSAYIKSHKGLSDLATVIGSADFTSHEKRIELLDLLGGFNASWCRRGANTVTRPCGRGGCHHSCVSYW